MSVTARPLNKRQRERAEKARILHAELVALTAQADLVRGKRNVLLRQLATDGVKSFVIANEAQVPNTVVRDVVNGRP